MFIGLSVRICYLNCSYHFSGTYALIYFSIYFIQIMGYKIFTYETHASYAARVENFRSYDTISKDIIQRWTYPFVPDVQYLGIGYQAKLERQGIYRAPGERQFVLS